MDVQNSFILTFLWRLHPNRTKECEMDNNNNLFFFAGCDRSVTAAKDSQLTDWWFQQCWRIYLLLCLVSMQGSKFYENEVKREQQVNQRIEKMMLQKEQITEQHLKKAQAQVRGDIWCATNTLYLNWSVMFCPIGGEDGCRAGKEARFNTCDCTRGHGCFLRCSGNARLSWAEGQTHGSGFYEHAGGFICYIRHIFTMIEKVLDEVVMRVDVVSLYMPAAYVWCDIPLHSQRLTTMPGSTVSEQPCLASSQRNSAPT